jgi:hypothetical protein
MNADTSQATIFETRLREDIEKRKGKAPVVPKAKVKKFIKDCIKLRFEPGWKLAGVILGRIMEAQLYLLSDDDPEQLLARLASRPEDQLGEHSADADAETQADDPAGVQPSDAPTVVQTDRVGQDVTTQDADERANPENEKPSSPLRGKSRDAAKFKEGLRHRMEGRLGRGYYVGKPTQEKILNACVDILENPQRGDATAILEWLGNNRRFYAIVDTWPQLLKLLCLPVQEPSENKSPSYGTAVDANQPATQTRPSAPKNEQRSEPGALTLNVSETVVNISEEPSEEPTRLSKAERKLLAECEKTIATGREAVFEANAALKRIRDRKLYREGFKTFEDYCFRTWSFRRSTAYQRIMWAQAHEILSAMADKSVEVNERQARALGGLGDEDMVRVWQQAVKASNTQNPTTKDIEAARAELNLVPLKSGAGKHNSKSSSDADQVTTPASSLGEFDPNSRWLTFRHQIDQEYGAWPLADRVAFRANLQVWLKEQEDGDDEARK